MSADLLAEFDSFYQAPQKTQSSATPSSNDLSILGRSNQNGQQTQRGPSSQWQIPTSKPQDDIWGAMTGFQPSGNAHQVQSSQDDIWGSFEAAAQDTRPGAQTVATTVEPTQRGSNVMVQGQDRPKMPRRSTLDLFANNMRDGDSVPSSPYKQPAFKVSAKPTPARKGSSGGDILFDADEISNDIEDDDEFGDFETGTPADAPPRPPPSQSLEGLFGATTLSWRASKKPHDILPSKNIPNNLPYPQAPKSPSFQERNPFSDLGLTMNQIGVLKKEDNPNSASPVTAWPTFEPSVPKFDSYQDSPAADNRSEDGWGDFSDLPLEAPAKAPVKPLTNTAINHVAQIEEDDAWDWDSVDNVSKAASAPVLIPPPTNIPPPSVLLPIFPPLFDLPQSSLFKAVANQPFSLKNRILSDPSTIEFLRAYLLIATVAARIVAGRKLRWKRDTLLTQSMKIGPSTAGGKGGMKLTGVDKAEVTREDREATDVVRLWKEQLGRLRSAVAVANTSIQNTSNHLVIPEISDTMQIKNQEGAVTAPKQCIICGLKREERINKVDVNVEDSFGEWWVEHWGHRACRNFWLEHEAKLKHR